MSHLNSGERSQTPVVVLPEGKRIAAIILEETNETSRQDRPPIFGKYGTPDPRPGTSRQPDVWACAVEDLSEHVSRLQRAHDELASQMLAGAAKPNPGSPQRIIIEPTPDGAWSVSGEGFDPPYYGVTKSKGRGALAGLYSFMRAFDEARGVQHRPVDSQIVLRPAYEGGWDLIQEHLPGTIAEGTLSHGSRERCLAAAAEVAAYVDRVLEERRNQG